MFSDEAEDLFFLSFHFKVSVLLFVCLLLVDKMGCPKMMLQIKRTHKITHWPTKVVALVVSDGVHILGSRVNLASFFPLVSIWYDV